MSRPSINTDRFWNLNHKQVYYLSTSFWCSYYTLTWYTSNDTRIQMCRANVFRFNWSCALWFCMFLCHNINIEYIHYITILTWTYLLLRHSIKHINDTIIYSVKFWTRSVGGKTNLVEVQFNTSPNLGLQASFFCFRRDNICRPHVSSSQIKFCIIIEI